MHTVGIKSYSQTRNRQPNNRPRAASTFLPPQSLWSAPQIAESTHGRIIKWAPPGTISTDTRTLIPNQWFFAITGPNFDGHDFITPDLYNKGCLGIIGNRACDNWDKGFVKLEHATTLNALALMGFYARSRHKAHVVGITGSVGKTTTCAMTALTLESMGAVHRTVGNQNNEIGVALTLIGIPRDAPVAVVEMGMSRQGEMLRLARMCRPTVRVILNVEPCHLENFRGLEDIASAKGEMLREMKPGDVCVLNADDPLVMNLPVPPGVKKVLFGRKIESDVRLVLAESIDGGYGVLVALEWNNERVEFVIQSPGLHLAHNACAAAAVSVLLGIPLPQVALSLSRFIPVHMRSELHIAENGIRIINDAYNACPASVDAAISLVKAIKCSGKRVIILGDMLELGPVEVTAHDTVLHLCCDASIGLVALVGKRLVAAAEKQVKCGSTNIICAPDSETLAVKIAEVLDKDDVVLVKGSRGMQMEKVVNAIKAIRIYDFKWQTKPRGHYTTVGYEGQR